MLAPIGYSIVGGGRVGGLCQNRESPTQIGRVKTPARIDQGQDWRPGWLRERSETQGDQWRPGRLTETSSD